MVANRITPRDSEVLHALVEAYVELGTPVGSRTLCAREGWDISSATVRNTLARLEQLGLVEQPHTSSGRAPTDRGYRLYVAERMAAGGFSAEAEDFCLLQELERRLRDGSVDEILGQLAQVLGEVSHQLGVVMAPRFERGILQRLELVPLASERVLLVATIRCGLARSLVLEVEARPRQDLLEEVARCLNERLAGLTLAEIRRSLRERLQELPTPHPQLLQAVAACLQELTAPHGAELHIAGARNICLKPEFNDPSQVAALMGVVERREELAHWLGARQGVVITIGREHADAAMKRCSVITASYEVLGGRGVIGVIGPTRMPYGRVVHLVSRAADQAAALAS